MKHQDLLKELSNMDAKEVANRLMNPALTNKQRQQILKLWYSLNRKNSGKMAKIDPPKK